MFVLRVLLVIFMYIVGPHFNTVWMIYTLKKKNQLFVIVALKNK